MPPAQTLRRWLAAAVLGALRPAGPVAHADDTGFDVLPYRVTTAHYEVIGTLSPVLLERFGRDMDFIHEQFAAEFASVLADRLEPSASDAKPMSRIRRRREARARRRQARERARTPATRPALTTAPADRHRIVVFANKAQFNAWRAQYAPKVSPWAYAFFSPRLKALVGHFHDGIDRAYSSFFHEGFHQIMHQHVPGAPTWLNEGLAEYYETARLTPAGWRFPAQAARFRRCATLFRERRLTPLRQLVTMDRRTFYGGKVVETAAGRRASEHYSEAYTFIYLLLAEAPTRRILQDYVRDLAKAKRSEYPAVTQKHFSPDTLAQLQPGWTRFLVRY